MLTTLSSAPQHAHESWQDVAMAAIFVAFLLGMTYLLKDRF